MGSDGEFGPDTENIRAWLEKRASYAKDARVVGSSSSAAVTPAPAPSEHRSDPGAQPGPDARDAARAVLAALDDPAAPGSPDPAGPTRTDRSTTRAGTRAARPPATAEPAPPATDAPAAPTEQGGRSVQVGRWTEPIENLTAHHATTDVDFPARGGGVRRILGLLLLASLLATGGASYLAYEDPTASTIGVAVVLGFLMLVIWAARAGCTTTQVSLRRGQLIVTRGGSTERVDLVAQHAPVAIVGEPGHRRWTVLLERPGRPLVVIDASMVDPHWFTSALYRLRPELRPVQPDPAQEARADHPGETGETS